MEIEKETGKNIYNILQLRLHPAIISLRKKILTGPAEKKYIIDLKYITARGHWYHTSWKGDISKSGGISTNIGFHFFDMLLWIFGDVKENIVFEHNNDRASGKLELEKATVNWFLSINLESLPKEAQHAGKTTYRFLTIDNEEIEFSDGFTELHTQSYKDIFEGKGILLKENLKVISLVRDIRNVKEN